MVVDPTGISQVVGQTTTNGTLIAAYALANGELFGSVNASGSPSFYSFDGIGNTSEITASSGSISSSYSYLPFGEVLSSTGSTLNIFTYQGQFGSFNTGMGNIAMRNRTYDPITGRFQQPDPTGVEGGTNLYVYAANDPLSFSDPNGTSSLSVQVGAATPLALAGYVAITLNSNGDVYIQPNAGVATFGPILGFTTGADVSEGYNLNASGGAGVIGNIDILQFLDGIDRNDALESLKSLSGGVGLKGISFTFAKTSRLYNVQDIPTIIVDFANELVGKVSSLGSSFSLTSLSCVQVGPSDPNFITGPTGSGSQDYLPTNSTLPYTIGFENKPDATAPAQVVTVTQQLSSNTDWSTFSFGNVYVGGNTYTVPSGLQTYSTRLDLTLTLGIFLDVAANFNAATGLATWVFTSIDPSTLDVPADPTVGFLPPNTDSPDGEGSVSYTVQAKNGLTTGSTIAADASIVFDQNATIDTGTYTNTIDASAPSSTVSALPNYETGPFTLNWSGSDAGSGIDTYSVFVSDNGAPYAPLLTDTTQTSTSYTGTLGHTYSFYSVATDNVGNVQATPAAAQTSTTIANQASLSNLSAPMTIAYGTATSTISGIIAAGSNYPAPGENVAVTLNGKTVQVPIGTNGAFSTTFDTSKLPASATAYPVTYNYPGDTQISSVFDNTSTTLKVNTVTPGLAIGSPPSTITYDGLTDVLSWAKPTLTGVTGANAPTGTATLTYYPGTTATGSPLTSPPADAGTYTVIATYAGDTNYNAATSNAVTFTISQATVTVSLPAPPADLHTSNETNWVVATVTGVTGAPAPTGSIAYTYYSRSSATGTPLASPPTTAGTFTVVASYGGNTDYLAGMSSAVTFTVSSLPSWITSASAATWNPNTHELQVTGAATITADPGSDEPIIDADGSSAQINVAPTTSLVVNVGGIALTNGATFTLASLGAARTESHKLVLVVGTSSATSTPTFSIDSTSTLNVSDNDVIINNGSASSTLIASVDADIRSAYDISGAARWDKPGLTSSNAAANRNFAIGVGQATSLGLTSFDNQPLASNALLLKYTLKGDTALTGRVQLGDYTKVVLNLGKSNTGWTDGNFDYSGTVNLSDYTAAIFNLGASLPGAQSFSSGQARPAATVASPASSPGVTTEDLFFKWTDARGKKHESPLEHVG